MSLYDASIPQLKKLLQCTDRWLDATVAFSNEKKIDPKVLLQSRLAPDQFPFVRQIQAACDAAKLGCARLAAKEWPKHEDTEQTIEELRARIAATLAFLDTLTRADFEGAEERPIELSFFAGKFLRGSDYLHEMVLPNFYFHVTTAYSILRHNGVGLGKRDFLGSLELRDKV